MTSRPSPSCTFLCISLCPSNFTSDLQHLIRTLLCSLLLPLFTSTAPFHVTFRDQHFRSSCLPPSLQPLLPLLITSVSSRLVHHRARFAAPSALCASADIRLIVCSVFFEASRRRMFGLFGQLVKCHHLCRLVRLVAHCSRSLSNWI
jgi:hypothetical protein